MVYYCFDCDKFIKRSHIRHKTIKIDLRASEDIIVFTKNYYFSRTRTINLDAKILEDLVNSKLIKKPKIYKGRKIYILSDQEYELFRSRSNILQCLIHGLYGSDYKTQVAIDSKVAAEWFVENLERILLFKLEGIIKDSFGIRVARMLREICKERNIILDALNKIIMK